MVLKSLVKKYFQRFFDEYLKLSFSKSLEKKRIKISQQEKIPCWIFQKIENIISGLGSLDWSRAYLLFVLKDSGRWKHEGKSSLSLYQFHKETILYKIKLFSCHYPLLSFVPFLLSWGISEPADSWLSLSFFVKPYDEINK